MAKYQRRSPVVEAVQWDGSKEDIGEILDFIRNTGMTTSFSVNFKIKRKKVSKAVIKIDKFLSGTIRPTDWLVSEGGGFQIVKHDPFVKEYVPVPMVEPIQWDSYEPR